MVFRTWNGNCLKDLLLHGPYHEFYYARTARVAFINLVNDSMGGNANEKIQCAQIVWQVIEVMAYPFNHYFVVMVHGGMIKSCPITQYGKVKFKLTFF